VAGNADTQPVPFPQQHSHQVVPSISGYGFAQAQYTFPKERTPFILSQEDVDQIAHLPQLPPSFPDASASSSCPSDPNAWSSDAYSRAPTPGFPMDWSAVDRSTNAPNYSGSQVLKDQLNAMTAEERASYFESRQYIWGISRGTTPALSSYYAPTPQWAHVSLLPSPGKKGAYTGAWACQCMHAQTRTIGSRSSAIHSGPCQR
jgi:hypothetical protein